MIFLNRMERQGDIFLKKENVNWDWINEINRIKYQYSCHILYILIVGSCSTMCSTYGREKQREKGGFGIVECEV